MYTYRCLNSRWETLTSPQMSQVNKRNRLLVSNLFIEILPVPRNPVDRSDTMNLHPMIFVLLLRQNNQVFED